MGALYIILLALFHDLQIVTIAYDRQVASKFPETPTVIGLLMQSYAMGILMFVQTMCLIAYGNLFMSDTFGASYKTTMDGPNGVEMDNYLETAIFLQISNSSAILILSARTVGFFFSTKPAWQLLGSTVMGQVLVNGWILFVGAIVEKMLLMDVLKIWAYDIAWLLVLDIVKMIAEKIWDKLKPWDIEHNPALAEQTKTQRQNRRASNSLMTSNVCEHKRATSTKTGRKSLRMDQ